MTIQSDRPAVATPNDPPRRQQVAIRRSSSDGTIAAAVDLDGQVVDMYLAGAALTRPADELAQDILRFLRAAQEAVR